MRYIELLDRLKGFTVFSLNDIRSSGGRFHRRRLNEWQEKGYIKKIAKGYYIFSDLKLDEGALFEIANRIYSPSYISFEAALSYYGMIPEAVYGVTSASTRKTYSLKAPIAEFSYRTISTGLFFGYDLIKHGDKHFRIASPEKAVLDYCYINKTIKEDSGYASLRIDKEAFFKKVSVRILNVYLRKIGQKALAKRVKALLEFIKHA